MAGTRAPIASALLGTQFFWRELAPAAWLSSTETPGEREVIWWQLQSQRRGSSPLSGLLLREHPVSVLESRFSLIHDLRWFHTGSVIRVCRARKRVG